MGPGRCDVERPDLRTLIRLTERSQRYRVDGLTGGTCEPRIASMELLVEGVGVLKPRTRIAEVEVNGIGCCELVVDSVEHVFLVAFVVHHGELRWIEESAAIQCVRGDEISPVLSAVS